MQLEDPAELYLPIAHWAGVADVDPALHTYPAVQLPVHAAVVRPAVEPYRPAGQSVQEPAPAREYLPATHWDAVPVVDPAGQAYPAVHGPVQVLLARALALP